MQFKLSFVFNCSNFFVSHYSGKSPQGPWTYFFTSPQWFNTRLGRPLFASSVCFLYHLSLPDTYSQRLLLFDALYGSFKTIRLRGKQSKCAICGETPTISQLIDYEQFCGSKATDKVSCVFLLSGWSVC